ncbi:disks large-associated protein 5 isoform X1 [Trachemys scripta elegans]|uniref:disks large-associated protein 5 isoform X1 n=1 Tax=Trachemys scripta elegans TaxID=31138 RepID=UPI001557F955|nr:disks large-associated protein 5 isoform X1 [Trachemys scripta elegans]
MAATPQFANRYRKDLSTETLRTKVARRKSLIQKENRHKQFERSRQFGLADVNVQLSKERGLPKLDETNEVCSQEKTTAKRKQTTDAAVNKSENERKQLLQRYKEEKELRKLKEQREKAKRGVFKVGLYRPNAPGFLPFVPQNPVIVKPKEMVAPTSSARITRSKAKSQAEQTVMSARSQQSMIYADHATNGHSVRPTQTGRRQICADKVTEKKKVVMQPEVPTASNVRITRATSSTLTKQMSKPATTMTLGNHQQKKTASRGKQQKEVKAENVEAHKREMEGNTLMDQLTEVSVSNSKNPTSEIHQEETLLEKENIPVTHIPVPVRQRTCSFAPQNFVFQPLDGLTTYKVTPMTPSRANAFLTPCLSWSPMKIEANVSKEESRKECLLKRQAPPAQEGTDKGSQEQRIGTNSLKVKNECASTKTQDAMQSSHETSPVSADISAIETKAGETDHDVPYFRNVLASETERLMSHCLQWDGKFELDIPEDAKDLIRTTVGQTRLLIAERFKQFEGLVDNCEFKRGDKETTCTDLDGFWDMVSFQVEDVNKKFDNLSKLQENGWQPVNIPSKRAIKKKAVPSGISKPKQGAAGRTAARNRIAAIRAAMKEKMKLGETAADSAAQEMPKEEEKVVFEAGFFRIESPLKSFPALPSKTPGRSSQRISKQLTTPRSASRTLRQSSLAILCSSEDTVAKQTTPAARGFHVPQNPNRLQAPTRKTLFGSTLEQSGSPLAEEQCSMTDGAAERTNETNVAGLEVCLRPDERSRSGPVDSQALEDPDTKIEMPDVTEDMELSATDLAGQDIVMRSPEKNVQSETDFIQAEKPHTPEYKSDLLHSDFISSDGTPFDVPSLNCSLPFTPVRNEAQKFAAAEIHNDLIVFSPLSPPSVEK